MYIVTIIPIVLLGGILLATALPARLQPINGKSVSRKAADARYQFQPIVTGGRQSCRGMLGLVGEKMIKLVRHHPAQRQPKAFCRSCDVAYRKRLSHLVALHVAEREYVPAIDQGGGKRHFLVS